MSTKEFRKWGVSLWADFCQGLGGPGLRLDIQAHVPGLESFNWPPGEAQDKGSRAREEMPATGAQS